MFACEDDEFVMFVSGSFKGSSVTLELPGVTVTELFRYPGQIAMMGLLMH